MRSRRELLDLAGRLAPVAGVTALAPAASAHTLAGDNRAGLLSRWFARDLNIRGALVTNALSDSIIEARGDAKRSRLQLLFDRAVQDERLFAIGLCSLDRFD